MIPPLYPFTIYNFFGKYNKNFLYFHHAREGLYFLLKIIPFNIVLVPSFTCPSVLNVLKNLHIDYNFIDLDWNLDFKLEDLDNMIDKYKDKKIALIATSLFNAPIRDYKRLYPDLVIIEDLAQSLPKYRQSSDFAIYSFGKGKLISTYGGGILEGCSDTRAYNALSLKNSFLIDYILAVLQKYLLKYDWKFLSNFYHHHQQYNFESKIEPTKICDRKKKWIANSIWDYNSKYRRKISDIYLEILPKELLFDLVPGRDYMRMPIKKRINSKEVSYMQSYKVVYEEALSKRGKKLEVAECLVNDCSFLPIHELVKEKDILRLVHLIKNS